MYDLTTTWNLDAVLEDAIKNQIVDGRVEEQVNTFRRMVSALYSFIDPKGDTDEARAINYVASAAVDFASKTKFMEGRVALRGLSRPAQVEAAREGDVVYEVVAQYFDIMNVQHALYHVRYTVDVSDTKPRLVGVSDVGFGTGQYL